MSPTSNPPRATPARLTLATTLALFAAGSAWGQSSPFVVGASETITHDSNVVRLPDDKSNVTQLPKATTDWIATTALFGGIDQPFGRQRAFGNLSVQDNHYRYNDYDNIAYGLAAGLIWSTIDRVSGTVKFNSNRTLADFDRGNSNAPDIQKNIEQTNQFAATASVGGVTDLTFDGGLRYQTQRFSVIGNKLTQTQYSFGARHRLGGELTLGAGLRFRNGRYPDLDDSFDGRTLDLSVDWVPSPISTVTSRLSFGKTDHSRASALDHSGVTGSLAWKWTPTGRLEFNTQVSRETGTETSFTSTDSAIGPLTAQGDNSRLTSTLGIAATYEAAAKILLNAGYTYQSRDLTNSLTQNIGPSGTVTDADRLTRLQFGARWLPLRTLEFACNVGRESRKADNNLLTYSYGVTTVGCSGQISINP